MPNSVGFCGNLSIYDLQFSLYRCLFYSAALTLIALRSHLCEPAYSALTAEARISAQIYEATCARVCRVTRRRRAAANLDSTRVGPRVESRFAAARRRKKTRQCARDGRGG